MFATSVSQGLTDFPLGQEGILGALYLILPAGREIYGLILLVALLAADIPNSGITYTYMPPIWSLVIRKDYKILFIHFITFVNFKNADLVHHFWTTFVSALTTAHFFRCQYVYFIKSILKSTPSF